MSRFINSDKVLSSLGKRSVTSGHHIQCNDSLDTPAVLVSVSETCLHLERKSHQLVKHHNFSFLHIHVADCTTISDTLHMYVLLQGNQLAPFRVTQQNDLVQFANMFTHVPCAWMIWKYTCTSQMYRQSFPQNLHSKFCTHMYSV